jgi:hypothetical protein
LHDDFGLNRLRAHFHGGLVEIGLEVEQRKARVAGKAAAIVPVRLAVDIGIVADRHGIAARLVDGEAEMHGAGLFALAFDPHRPRPLSRKCSPPGP